MEFLLLSVADVSPRETSPVAKSEEKRMFSQAMILMGHLKFSRGSTLFSGRRWDHFMSGTLLLAYFREVQGSY